MAEIVHVLRSNAIARLVTESVKNADEFDIIKLYDDGFTGFRHINNGALSRQMNKIFHEIGKKYVVVDELPGDVLEFEAILTFKREQLINRIIASKTMNTNWDDLLGDYAYLLRNGFDALKERSDNDLINYYIYVCHSCKKVKVILNEKEGDE